MSGLMTKVALKAVRAAEEGALKEAERRHEAEIAAQRRVDEAKDRSKEAGNATLEASAEVAKLQAARSALE